MSAAHRKTSAPVLFKQGMRALIGAVNVIAVPDVDGEPGGLTATAVTSLSAEPPSLLVCVNTNSSIAPALTITKAFSVNVLAQGQEDVAGAFGGQKNVRGKARFSYGTWTRSDHDIPLLIGARVNFECAVEDVHTFATHLIVVGRVVEVYISPLPLKPLLYGDGHYLTTG
jgi:flavin reductase (DIM6/NTAB) family NADH-FMN oxidoreductase RutF